MTDLYAPFREPLALDWREADLDEAFTRGLSQLETGHVPLHIYLYGGWGSGKTHLLASLEQRWKNHKDFRLILVRDVEIPRSSEGWLLSTLGSDGRRVALIDRLDRHLSALDAHARWRLRRALQQQEGLWVIGTGAAIDGSLFGREEAFYQFFDAWNVPIPDEARACWLGSGGDGEGEAHAVFAGTIPRNLRALATAPGGRLSERLHSALCLLAPDHRSRLYALALRAQQIVSIIAASSRPVQPTELAQRLSLGTAAVAVACGRLVDEQVLEKTRRGREVYYTLRDDMWRHGTLLLSRRWEETGLEELAEWVSLTAGLAPRDGEDELYAAMRAADLGALRRLTERERHPPKNPMPCRALPPQLALWPRASGAFWETEAGSSWAASFASLDDVAFASRLSELSGVVRAKPTPAGTLALATLAQRRPERFAALAVAESPLVARARTLAELLVSTPSHREFAFLASRIRGETSLQWRLSKIEASMTPSRRASGG